MMKITGLSHLFKWENLHNWWLTKYFFAPLYDLCSVFIMFKTTFCLHLCTFNLMSNLVQHVPCLIVKYDLRAVTKTNVA